MVVERCVDLSPPRFSCGLRRLLGDPRSLGRGLGAAGLPVPDDPEPPSLQLAAQQSMFDDAPFGLPGGAAPIVAAVAVHADQQRRLAALPAPGRCAAVAAESACGWSPWR